MNGLRYSPIPLFVCICVSSGEVYIHTRAIIITYLGHALEVLRVDGGANKRTHAHPRSDY